MSKTKQFIELRSPSLGTDTERLAGMVQDCHYCAGRGWWWERDERDRDVKKACPMCKGSGKLRPYITVEWKPEGIRDAWARPVER